MIYAPINKILPYSVVDGPGNRVAIFVQKCNIHCLYCHNPETQNMCFNCGECVNHCPAGALKNINEKVIWDETKCISCDTCIKICNKHASPKIKYMTPSEVYSKVKESEPFIRGISVSGGECDLYPEFLTELFKLVKKDNLTCLMDCNGTIDLQKYSELINLSDGVMLDVKAWDNNVFQKLTGFSNENLKKNLKFLDLINKIEEIRIVSLPDYVDAEEAIDGISKILSDNSKRNIPLKLIRFRHFGVKGLLSNHQSPSYDYMKHLQNYASSKGFKNIQII